jgi:hypothetical protein
LLWKDTFDPYNNKIDSSLIPKFEKLRLDEWHSFNGETSLPVRGSALIDFDNDGIDEIFLWWWAWQDDQVFSYRDGSFVDDSKKYSIKKWTADNTLAASSVDLDWNWYSDLIVSRDSYVSIYFNEWNILREEKPELWLNDISSPLWLTFWDINKDGYLDIFLSAYVLKEEMSGLTNFSPGYGATSALLLNNWDNTFKNITTSSGLEYIHNTFQWIFIDLNNDSWLDLVVAHDTGEPRIYKNNWDMTFSLKENPFTWKYAYPMWIAIWDYDNDNDADIFFSNIGSTLPKAMVKGDIEDVNDLKLEWFLLRNDWDFRFTDTAAETMIQDYEFSWWGVFADMNNDWLQDLLVAENYVDLSFQKLFKLPWRFLLQKKDGTFASAWKQTGASNKHFWITPLVSDFNNDGNQDIVWVNISESSYVFMNKGIGNNYFQLEFPDTADFIWSRVTVKLPSWRMISEDFIIWEWLVSDQSNVLHFWLWKEESIDSLEIQLVNGKKMQAISPEINTKLFLDARGYEKE